MNIISKRGEYGQNCQIRDPAMATNIAIINRRSPTVTATVGGPDFHRSTPGGVVYPRSELSSRTRVQELQRVVYLALYQPTR